MMVASSTAAVARAETAPLRPSLSVALTAAGATAFVAATARNVPLHTVLTEIATRAGVQLTEMQPLSQPLSIRCQRAPLDVVLTQLLQAAGASFMLVYHPAPSQRLHAVVVLRADSERQGRLRSSAGRESPQPPDAVCVPLTAPPSIVRPPSEETLEVALPSFGAETSLDELLAATTAPDVHVQTAALEALAAAYATDVRAQQTLLASIHDPDAYVRSVIVGALGPMLTQWPGAEDVVLGALRDPEPAVRRQALAVFGEYATPQLPAALNIALQDSDPGIREQAQELLHDDPLPGGVDP